MERALLAQPPESCTSVYPNSPPARLGLDFLPRVLEALAGFLPLPLFWVEALSSCVSHLAAGAGAQGGLPRLCAELAVAGVNDDEQSWAAEPARVNDAESRWEDDRTSLNTESLLELFATNLTGQVPSRLCSESWMPCWPPAPGEVGGLCCRRWGGAWPRRWRCLRRTPPLTWMPRSSSSPTPAPGCSTSCCSSWYRFTEPNGSGWTRPLSNWSDVCVRLRRCEPSSTRVQRASDKADRR